MCRRRNLARLAQAQALASSPRSNANAFPPAQESGVVFQPAGPQYEEREKSVAAASIAPPSYDLSQKQALNGEVLVDEKMQHEAASRDGPQSDYPVYGQQPRSNASAPHEPQGEHNPLVTLVLWLVSQRQTRKAARRGRRGCCGHRRRGY